MKQRIIFYKDSSLVLHNEGTPLLPPADRVRGTILAFERGEINTLVVRASMITGWRAIVKEPENVVIDFRGEFDEGEIAQANARVIRAI